MVVCDRAAWGYVVNVEALSDRLFVLWDYGACWILMPREVCLLLVSCLEGDCSRLGSGLRAEGQGLGLWSLVGLVGKGCVHALTPLRCMHACVRALARGIHSEGV